MEQKINIAELLKDCPKGMELDCTMFENVTFEGIEDVGYINILIKTPNGQMKLSKYGCFIHNCEKAKCVIFPKGKTTWEGFQRPFKDGDVLSYQYNGYKNRTIYIYMQHSKMNTTYYVALSGNDKSEFMVNHKEGYALNGYNKSVRLATEEEKEKLFKAIKENGYRWNAETKTLEELPKFKMGDKIKRKGDTRLTTIKDIRDNYYIITTPNFFGNAYITDKLLFSNQNEYELVPDKFDITTLKPFESRVLVRDINKETWKPAFFGYFLSTTKDCPFMVGGIRWKQCIPYEGNEHLLGKMEDCDEYYKIWE